MKFEYFIGLRYLRARRKQTMISVITGISTFGVALGVAALIIVLAVMTGFEEDLRKKILGTNAHIVILPFDYKDTIEDYPDIIEKIHQEKDIIDVSAFIYQKVMITHGTRTDGIVLKGIDPSVRGACDIGSYIVQGSMDYLDSPEDLNLKQRKGPQPRNGIILGIELAANLGARVGEAVSITSSSSTLTPMGFIPKAKAYTVVGLFQSGMFEYDRTMAYISIESAQLLIGLGKGINGFEVRVTNIFKTEEYTEKLRRVLGSRFWVRDWQEMNRTFFSALKLEKLAMFIILTLIVFVAAFNIIGSLTMMVMEKHKDIGILKAMGASKRSIGLIFLTEGVIIGMVGTTLGFIIGTAVSWFADKYHLIKLEGEVYYMNYLPFSVRWWDIVAVCLASLLISFVATIYPARQAAKLNPVEAIRYE